MTDDDRLTDPIARIRTLPAGSLIIVRSRSRAHRSELARMLPGVSRECGLRWSIADDAALAAEHSADGVHFPEREIALAAEWRARRPRWLITCAAHSLSACARAARAHADAALLGPVFPTQSHPEKSPIGALRARLIASQARIPIYALGGINARSAKQLDGAPLCGLAGIDVFAKYGKADSASTIAPAEGLV